MLSQFRSNPRMPLIVAVAILAMVVAGLVMWSRQPDYRVLFTNLSDRDGGAIVAALQQGNMPYKIADAGGAILVPAEQVHETRLRLASQGLPKNGSVGFELMDNQKFGTSQFAEQVNYQRALEGELEKTIGSISSVKSARVHLAMPKPTVFVREKERRPPRSWSSSTRDACSTKARCCAIVHMVSAACRTCRSRTSISSTRTATCSRSKAPRAGWTRRSSSMCSRSSTTRKSASTRSSRRSSARAMRARR